MAGRYREWFGGNWQTTRNSGRTDLPGDIYCEDVHVPIVVECKHRTSWGLDQIIRNTKEYRKSLGEVLTTYRDARNDLWRYLHVWRKDVHGMWVMGWREGVESPLHINQLFLTDVRLSLHGVTWHRVKGVVKRTRPLVDVL